MTKKNSKSKKLLSKSQKYFLSIKSLFLKVTKIFHRLKSCFQKVKPLIPMSKSDMLKRRRSIPIPRTFLITETINLTNFSIIIKQYLIILIKTHHFSIILKYNINAPIFYTQLKNVQPSLDCQE